MPEPAEAAARWGGMADNSRASPVLGALIATAALAYAASRRKAEPTRRPAAAPKRPGWGRILVKVWHEIDRDNIPVMAAGCAFYGFLSIFPAMSAVISTYGLVADPVIIGGQVASLAGVLPQAALELLSAQLHALISAPRDALGVGLIVSLALTVWSAMSGTGTLMRALTAAYEEQERRGLIGFYGRSAALTIGVAVFGLVSLFMIAVIPAVIDWLPFPAAWRDAVSLIRWPILAALVFVAFSFVYRFAPDRRIPRWNLFAPGTVAAVLLWLAGSAGFSFYVARFASYDKTYGSLGAVVVLLMWLYVSAYIVLAGAELNSEVERAGATGEPAEAAAPAAAR